MKTRMWIREDDHDGSSRKQFKVDEPVVVPQVGEFVDSDTAGGWVYHVQHEYRSASEWQDEPVQHIINVSLRKSK